MSIVIGLTGGTGCGKSTAALYFKEKGAFIIDADQIAREIVMPGKPALAEIAASFNEVLCADGSLNRKKLGALVFADKNALARLNQITHTYIINEIKEHLQNSTNNLTVIDAPLLLECSLDKLCTVTVAVLSSEALRTKRIMLRDGITEEVAKNRIASQQKDDYYRKHCDYIIENNREKEVVFRAIDQILKELSL